MPESSDKPIKVYEGRGETLAQALEDAAVKALDDDSERNLGGEFVIVQHIVRVDNPRISEHKISIGG